MYEGLPKGAWGSIEGVTVRLKGGIGIENGIVVQSSDDVGPSGGIDGRDSGLTELTQIGELSSLAVTSNLLNGGDKRTLL